MIVVPRVKLSELSRADLEKYARELERLAADLARIYASLPDGLEHYHCVHCAVEWIETKKREGSAP